MSTAEVPAKTSSKAAKSSRVISSKASRVEATWEALVESTGKARVEAAPKAWIEASSKPWIEASVAVTSNPEGKPDGEVPWVGCGLPRVSCAQACDGGTQHHQYQLHDESEMWRKKWYVKMVTDGETRDKSK